MQIPSTPSRMPSHRLRARRPSTPRLTATLASLAALGCATAIVALPADAAPRERRPPVTRTAATAPTTTASTTATTTTTRGFTTAKRVLPLRASSTRLRTRISALPPAAAEVVRLVNVARAGAGCAPLRVDSRLTAAARLHSEDMARQDYFSHTSLDGRSPWDRIEAQGYTAGSGENIAAGYTTPAAVMTAWMNSAGHRANILACSSRAIGVGIGYGGSYGTYWTQDFGRE